MSLAAAELSRGNLDWRVRPRTQDEIGELAVTFNKMAEEIKLQDSLRNTFIANVSHELRTPLAAIQGFIQGMLDRAIEENDRDKYLDIVLGETKRMNSLDYRPSYTCKDRIRAVSYRAQRIRHKRTAAALHNNV